MTQRNERNSLENSWATIIILPFIILTTALLGPAFAQYSLDWHTIDGGGGTSTGGVYSVTGNIGQHDAGGPLTNGQYSLTGGFWSLYALQMPGASLLSINLNPQLSTVIVSWPSPSTDWALQQSSNLNTTNWVTPSETVNDDGTNKFITVNLPVGVRTHRLYRLVSP